MLVFFTGKGRWIWWHAALAAACLSLAGVAVYAWIDPKGPGGGAFLMFIAFCLAWLLMLAISTVDILLWSSARKHGWKWRLVLVPVAWTAVGLLWTFLFWATDPNYPEMLLPGRLLLSGHVAALYLVNLGALATARRAAG